MCHNQGNAFRNAGYSNWKKQYSNITKHEKSESHINAKVAQVVFLQGRSSIHAWSNHMGATRKERNFASEERSHRKPQYYGALSTLCYIWESRDLLSEDIESR